MHKRLTAMRENLASCIEYQLQHLEDVDCPEQKSSSGKKANHKSLSPVLFAGQVKFLKKLLATQFHWYLIIFHLNIQKIISTIQGLV